VYNKVYLQMDKYAIHRKNTFEPVQDGVYFLKTITDNYHSNTRSSAKLIRKQLATLNYYTKNVAKGDVTKLCEHTREFLFELNAAGETTNDLRANLIEALKEALITTFKGGCQIKWTSGLRGNWIGNKMAVISWRRQKYTTLKLSIHTDGEERHTNRMYNMLSKPQALRQKPKNRKKSPITTAMRK